MPPARLNCRLTLFIRGAMSKSPGDGRASGATTVIVGLARKERSRFLRDSFRRSGDSAGGRHLLRGRDPCRAPHLERGARFSSLLQYGRTRTHRSLRRKRIARRVLGGIFRAPPSARSRLSRAELRMLRTTRAALPLSEALPVLGRRQNVAIGARMCRGDCRFRAARCEVRQSAAAGAPRFA